MQRETPVARKIKRQVLPEWVVLQLWNSNPQNWRTKGTHFWELQKWYNSNDPVWLAVSAGVRFSDLFTDVSYILAVPSLTTLGWIFLVPPPFLNLVGALIILSGYSQARPPVETIAHS